MRGEILPENAFDYQQLQARGQWRFVDPHPEATWNTPYWEAFMRLYGHNWLSAKRRLRDNNGYFRIPSNALVKDRWEGTLTSASGMAIRAENKLSKKLNSTDIDLGVALGEARETAHMLSSAMLSTFVAAKRAKRGDFSGMLKALGLSANTDPKLQRFRDIPDKAAGCWLGYSYGVRPLLSDVFGAVSALEKRMNVPDVITRRVSTFEEIDLELQGTYNARPGFGDPDTCLKFKGGHRCSEKLTFTVANPFTYTLSQLGLTNPLNVAWELVTLSFVVDWFLPIGSWIQGLVPPQGVTSIRRTSTWKGYVDVEADLIFRDGQRCPVKANEKWKTRTVKSTWPRFHLVGASFDLSKQQVASGLSLLWTFGASEKSQAKAYKDAVDLNSRRANISGSAGSLSRDFAGYERRFNGRKSLRSSSNLFPESYSRI
jgi:hypothetical protein